MRRASTQRSHVCSARTRATAPQAGTDAFVVSRCVCRWGSPFTSHSTTPTLNLPVYLAVRVCLCLPPSCVSLRRAHHMAHRTTRVQRHECTSASPLSLSHDRLCRSSVFVSSLPKIVVALCVYACARVCECVYTFSLAYVYVLPHELTGPLPLPTTQRLAATANQEVGASVFPIPLVCVGAMSAATLLTTRRAVRVLWGYMYMR